jgi:hypothetical protein
VRRTPKSPYVKRRHQHLSKEKVSKCFYFFRLIWVGKMFGSVTIYGVVFSPVLYYGSNVCWIVKFFNLNAFVLHFCDKNSIDHCLFFSRRNLTPDAISFAQKSLDAGAKPLLVRKNVMLEFGANLSTKDVLNLKTKLSGKRSRSLFLNFIHNELINITDILVCSLCFLVNCDM